MVVITDLDDGVCDFEIPNDFGNGSENIEVSDDQKGFHFAIMINHEIRTLIMEKVNRLEIMDVETNDHDLESKSTPQQMEDSNSNDTHHNAEVQQKSLNTTLEVNVVAELDDSAVSMIDNQNATDDSTVTFPHAFVIDHNIKIKFGSFGETSLHHDMSHEIASNSVPIQDEKSSTSVVKQSDDQIKEIVAEENKMIIKIEEAATPTEMLENEQSEETDESRKAVELMKEESEANLKERRQLEAKMKAKEAMERKKRNDEKAQTRAEMQAKKEAEQKEKARLKRLRKRERKRAAAQAGADAATSSSINGGDVAESNESKVIEKANEKPRQRPPPPHSLSKYLKPKIIPPPPAVVAAIRNKRRWQQWQNVVIGVILLLVVFSLS